MPKRPPIPHPTDTNLTLIPLTRGYVAMIDSVDAESVGQFSWHALVLQDGLVYATRNTRTTAGVPTSQRLHRFIGNRMGLSLGVDVDHDDGDGLNNRRLNLRDASKTENAWNMRRHRDNRSGVKGVSWDASRQKWRAQLQIAGKNTLLGRYESLAAAEDVVKDARLRLHGEFACHGRDAPVDVELEPGDGGVGEAH